MKFFWSAYFFIKTALIPCGVDVQQGFEKGRKYYKVERIARFDGRVDENSGLVLLPNGTLLSHNDSGGEPTLYTLGMDGTLIDSVTLPIPNKDWEDIAMAPDGRIFIADTGNNRNKRQDLCIYVYDPSSGSIEVRPIRYADQTEYPPAPENQNFDCEGVTFYQGELHLFSKNRGESDSTKHYILPLPTPPKNAVQASNSEVALASVEQCRLYKQQVTGAAISPNGQVMALLTYGRIYLFQINGDGKALLQKPWRVIKCNRMGQSEGICFLDNETMLFSNERGKLFKVGLNKRGLRQSER